MQWLKKIYKETIYIVMIPFLLCSCNNEDSYDIYGDTECKLYFTNSSVVKTFQIEHTLLGSKGDPINVKLPISCTQKVSEDVYVQLSIDNSYVEEYNRKNGTSYSPVSKEIILFENSKVKIPKDSNESEIKPVISIVQEKYAELNEKSYLIPVVIESASGNVSISNERKVIYSFINTTVNWDNIDTEATPESVNVEFIEDRSAWTGEFSPVPPTIKGTYHNLLDSDETTGSRGNPYSYNYGDYQNVIFSLIMDLKEEYEIAGFYLNGIKTDTKIFVSSDKETWQGMGTVPNTNKDVLFYVPIKARYLRCEFPSVQSYWTGMWTSSARLYEFKCYVKK